MSLHEAKQLLETYSSQHALSALSSGSQIVEAIQYRQSNKVWKIYDYASSNGDNQAVRGILEVLDVLDSRYLIQKPFKEYDESDITTSTSDPILVKRDNSDDFKDNIDMFLDQSESHYSIQVNYLNQDGDSIPVKFDLCIENQYGEYLYDNWNNTINFGYKPLEYLKFEVTHKNDGVCKVSIRILEELDASIDEISIVFDY